MLALRIPIALALALTAIPVAIADETHADCETDQPWIGYARSDPARAIAEPALANAGLELDACEGEQWDGQDTVQDDSFASCAGMVNADPGDLIVGMCSSADPNTDGSDDITTPIGFRVSMVDQREIYAGTNVAHVSRAAVYVGACGAGEPGLEGDATCGGTRELRTGMYVRDNTPGNVITQFTPQCLFSITGCWPTENDCSQATYQAGQYDPPSQCARDNTAIGARIVVLP